MQIGDLVCYNAAGQKYKTLGLVLDFKTNIHRGHWDNKQVLIQWCMVGDYMPRRDWGELGWTRDDIKPGEFVWHTTGDWFEVVNE